MHKSSKLICTLSTLLTFITFDKVLDSVNLNRHAFDPKTCVPDEKAEIIGADKVFQNVIDMLFDKIPAFSVQVYTTHVD